MSFISPWFLLGLLGVAVPVVIHLGRRQKAEKVVFSTIRFLKKTPQKMIRFQQIQQWLLLLLRAAVIALLVIAFARPFFLQFVPAGSGMTPRSLVVVLDTSMSMQYDDAFGRAQKAALEVLGSLRTGDEATLVPFSDGTGQVTELTTDLARVAASVRNLESAGFKSTHYLPALRLADQMLRSARHPHKTVYLISDFQRQAVDDFNNRWRLSPGVAFEGISIGAGETTNLAVTEVKSPAQLAQDQQEQVIIGRVRSLGSRTPPAARISLLIDDQNVATQKVDLSDRAEALVTFRAQFDKRKTHRVALTVEDEHFIPDNTFYFTVGVRRPLAVLGIARPASAGKRVDASRWLRSALNTGAGSLFRLDLIRPGEFTGDGLQQYDVVALLNIGELTLSQAERIAAYTARGGGLLMAPGSRVTAQSFNQLWRDLTPALLEQEHVAADGEFLTIAGINRRHPIVKLVGLNENGDFGAARFRGHWKTQPADGSDVILRFDNGAAALLEKEIGRGRALLFTFPLDTSWNNLPRRGLYVPLMHEALRYLASREPIKSSYVVGEPVRLNLPAGNAVRVTGPTGDDTILTSAIENAAYYRTADRPGYYTVGGGQTQEVLAVNTAPAESNLEFVAADQIGSVLTPVSRSQPVEPDAPDASIAAQAEKAQRLWWWLLLAVIFLGLGETLLANRTYR